MRQEPFCAAEKYGDSIVRHLPPCALLRWRMLLVQDLLRTLEVAQRA